MWAGTSAAQALNKHNGSVKFLSMRWWKKSRSLRRGNSQDLTLPWYVDLWYSDAVTGIPGCTVAQLQKDGGGHRKKSTCTAPDQLPGLVSQAAGALSLNLILRKKGHFPLRVQPFESKGQGDSLPWCCLSPVWHTCWHQPALLSTQHRTDPEQSLPCCEANAKEVADLNSKSLQRLLGVLTSPILIDRGSREATLQSELHLEWQAANTKQA